MLGTGDLDRAKAPVATPSPPTGAGVSFVMPASLKQVRLGRAGLAEKQKFGGIYARFFAGRFSAISFNVRPVKTEQASAGSSIRQDGSAYSSRCLINTQFFFSPSP